MELDVGMMRSRHMNKESKWIVAKSSGTKFFESGIFDPEEEITYAYATAVAPSIVLGRQSGIRNRSTWKSTNKEQQNSTKTHYEGDGQTGRSVMRRGTMKIGLEYHMNKPLPCPPSPVVPLVFHGLRKNSVSTVSSVPTRSDSPLKYTPFGRFSKSKLTLRPTALKTEHKLLWQTGESPGTT